MRYLLDADWIIQVLAGRSKAVLAHKGINPEEIAVSYITIGEIYDVAYTYANPEAHLHTFRRFLTPFPLLDMNEPFMERFAEIRAYLRRCGELISDFDILMVPIRHFKRISDLKLYQAA